MGCLSWEGLTGSCPVSLGVLLRSSGALPAQAPFPPAPGAAATAWASRLPPSRARRWGAECALRPLPWGSPWHPGRPGTSPWGLCSETSQQEVTPQPVSAVLMRRSWADACLVSTPRTAAPPEAGPRPWRAGSGGHGLLAPGPRLREGTPACRAPSPGRSQPGDDAFLPGLPQPPVDA